MTSTIKWLVIAAIVFLLVGTFAHWHIAFSLVGAPLFGVTLGWLFEKVFPHAYDSTVKDR